MKPILYATDYSENSVAALKYALILSLKLKTQLMVIHVLNYPTILRTKTRESSPDLDMNSLCLHTAKLEKFCKKHLGSDYNKTNITFEAIQNKSAVNGILCHAKEVKSSLIITGMKGASKLWKMIMGRTARELIENAPYPVLTIPGDSRFSPVATFVYATNFKKYDLDAIKKLAEFARPLKAKIKIVHVAPLEKTIPKRKRRELKESIQRHVNYTRMDLDILNSDDIFNELKIYFSKTQANMASMFDSESHSHTSDSLYSNLIKKMKSYGRIPLMSFNDNNYLLLKL